MGYQLDQVASVTITLESAGLSQAGFGVPLIVGPNGTVSGIATISSASEMTTSYGYSTTDPEYQKAVAIFAQSPSVSTVRIGKLANGVVGENKYLTPTGSWTSGSFSLEVQGETVTEAFDSDEATSYGNLATAIAALDDVASASWDSGNSRLDVVSVAGKCLSVEVVSFPDSVTALAQEIQTGSSTLESDLNDLTATDKEFYALLIASSSAPDINDAVSYVNANEKLLFAKTSDKLALVASETSSLAYSLNNAAQERVALMYQDFSYEATEEPDAALAGVGLPYQPGEITWKFKSLVGISAEALNAGQDAELISKKVNFVVTSNSRNFTKEGTVSSGEFIDVIRGIDWTKARVQESILALKLSKKKVPYTTQGLALISGAIREVLRQGVVNTLFNDDFEISVPDIADVSATDKSNRILNNVTFNANLQGAIHKSNISGTVVA
jgi:hypothetical protein